MPADTVGRRLPLAALVGANAISLLGDVVAAVAIPWFVLVTTGSVARTGIAAFFTTLPLALGAFFGGAIADAVGPRRASVAGDLASAAAIAAIPLLHALGALAFWHVVALAFVGALFDAPAQAAREALLPDVARRAGVTLERATALWTSTEHTGYVLGAPVAGVLIATLGAPNALWLDAASFLLAAGAVLAAVSAVPTVRERKRYAEELVEGLRFVAGDAVLRTFLATATVGNFLIAPLAPVLLPVYARDELGGARDLGLLVGVYGAGGLAGAVAFAVASGRVPRRPLFAVVWAVYPLLWAALVPLPRLLLAATILLLVGLAAGALGPLEQVVRQERTPPELRGRVFATFMASLTFVVPPAALAAALLVEAAGLRTTVAVLTVGNAALTVWVLAGRAWRSI